VSLFLFPGFFGSYSAGSLGLYGFSWLVRSHAIFSARSTVSVTVTLLTSSQMTPTQRR